MTASGADTAYSYQASDLALLALRSKLLGLQNPILISLEKMRNKALDSSYVATFTDHGLSPKTHIIEAQAKNSSALTQRHL